MKYGYMDHHHKSNKSAPLLSRDGSRDYVEKFQGFAGDSWSTDIPGKVGLTRNIQIFLPRAASDGGAGPRHAAADADPQVRGEGRCGHQQGQGQGQEVRPARWAHTRQELLLTILWARLPVECPHPAVQDLPLPHLHYHDPGPGGHDMTHYHDLTCHIIMT